MLEFCFIGWRQFIERHPVRVGCHRLTIALLLVALLATTPLKACPFCEATSPTWLQTVAEAETAVIARAVKVQSPAKGDDVVPLVDVTFELVEVLRGQEQLRGTRQFHCELLETPRVGAQWLLNGAGAPQISWSPLAELTPERAKYFATARKLPSTGNARWQWFYQYLEHADELLAADAYGEFAGAPFAEVQGFGSEIKRAQLWQWIRREQTPEHRRGLYYTMLGVCGTAADVTTLEALLVTPEKRPPGGFDALIACYLSLRGEAGLKVVEAKLLHDKAAREEDVQAVLLALRFHGEEQHVLKRTQIAQAYRLVLDRPQLAGVVIPDLARWQDWDSMDALVALFKTSDRDAQWLRIPIVAYLRACPLPKAKEQLTQLAKIDPEAIEQADSLSLFGVKLRGVPKP